MSLVQVLSDDVWVNLDSEGHRVRFERLYPDEARFVETFWTVKGVAVEAGVSGARVRQLLGEGRFPGAAKVMDRWLIPEGAVKAYLAYPDRRRSDVPKQGELTGVSKEAP